MKRKARLHDATRLEDMPSDIHASYGNSTGLTLKLVETSIFFTCMKRLRARPQLLYCVNHFALRKRA
jgi:hypothetical protein